MTESIHEVTWHRSSACADGSCLEIARSGGEMFLRNNQRPNEVTRFTIDEWEAFTAGVKAGDFPF